MSDNDKVRPLHSGVVVESDLTPDPDIISALEDALAEARSGKIRAFVAVYFSAHQESRHAVVTGRNPYPGLPMIGGVYRLLQEVSGSAKQKRGND